MRPVPEPGDSTAGDGPRKAYEDLDFLRSAETRTIRVVAELLEPQYRLANHDIRNTIVFFGSARIPDPARAQDGPDNLARLASHCTDTPGIRPPPHRVAPVAAQRQPVRRL